MAQDTPGRGTAHTPPASSAGTPHERAPRVAILVGLLVFAVAAAGSFALTGGFGGTVGQSVACGGSQRCIPSLTTGDVVGTLTAEGYECRAGGVGQSCQTQIGPNLYEALLSASVGNPDRIAAVNSRVTYPAETAPSSATKSYLAWFASLPYGDDQVTVAEVTAWLTEQVDGGQDAAVTIGGYNVGVAASQPGRVVLSIRGA